MILISSSAYFAVLGKWTYDVVQSLKLKGKLGTNWEKEALRMPLDKTRNTKEITGWGRGG